MKVVIIHYDLVTELNCVVNKTEKKYTLVNFLLLGILLKALADISITNVVEIILNGNSVVTHVTFSTKLSDACLMLL